MSCRSRKLGVFVNLLVLFVVGGMRVRLVEAGDGEEVQCLRQMSSRELSQCMDYLVYGHQGPPEMFWASYNSEVLDQCCAHLGKVKQECRCEAIHQMLDHEEKKRIERQKLEGVVRRARNLPAMCSMEPHRCDFQVYGF